MNNKKQLQEATISMIHWLSHPNELGHIPYNIVCTHSFYKDDERFYVFKFQKKINEEWLLGVCGGYESDETLDHSGIVFSHFQKYSDGTAIQKAIEIIEAIQAYWKKENENWPTEEWPFEDSPQTAVFTTKSITNREKDVMIVFHDEEDGAWQFFDGEKVCKDNVMIISLKEMVDLDFSINYLAKMKTGYFAVRESIDSDWKIYEQ